MLALASAASAAGRAASAPPAARSPPTPTATTAAGVGFRRPGLCEYEGPRVLTVEQSTWKGDRVV